MCGLVVEGVVFEVVVAGVVLVVLVEVVVLVLGALTLLWLRWWFVARWPVVVSW